MKKEEKNVDNFVVRECSCVLRATKHNGFINFYLDIEDMRNVCMRLVVPNNKKAYRIYAIVNKLGK